MVKELGRALRRGRAARRATRGRCSTRTSGSPPATASTASSSTCRLSDASATKALARRLLDRLREHAQDLGSAARARRASRTCWSAATAPRARSLVYEANHDLREVMAEIVAATTGEPRVWPQYAADCSIGTGLASRSSNRARWPGARPVRGLQELRIRGQPVHHRVPVLRQPAAQARAEDRAPRRRGPSARARRRPAPPLTRCAPTRSPASAATDAPAVRDDGAAGRVSLFGILLWPFVDATADSAIVSQA